MTDEEFEYVEKLGQNALAELDDYIRARKDGLRLIASHLLDNERERLARAIYALVRGYAPAHLPTREQREQKAVDMLLRTDESRPAIHSR